MITTSPRLASPRLASPRRASTPTIVAHDTPNRYAATRPFLIHQGDLDTLCQTVAALQEEVSAQQATPDDAGQAVETILSRLVQDAQVKWQILDLP